MRYPPTIRLRPEERLGAMGRNPRVKFARGLSRRAIRRQAVKRRAASLLLDALLWPVGAVVAVLARLLLLLFRLERRGAPQLPPAPPPYTPSANTIELNGEAWQLYMRRLRAYKAKTRDLPRLYQ